MYNGSIMMFFSALGSIISFAISIVIIILLYKILDTLKKKQ